MQHDIIYSESLKVHSDTWTRMRMRMYVEASQLHRTGDVQSQIVEWGTHAAELGACVHVPQPEQLAVWCASTGNPWGVSNHAAACGQYTFAQEGP